ncbi:MOSC domain-containing protein [Altericroceibacterium spongiae]|uniref:MOSC domain-containing protein n=1 Tax=Altericroceibacterium spongiae TaxID=2320269 RepID=A0A420ER95_9SPHN|nr:MOSC domain-containing protein [Altericroceibacterium spongiae]RKF23199.1 MOSC domain-containing protein [Altericroceibacterium spongiae]
MHGSLQGIARHSEPRGEIEVLSSASISPETGISGDFRGGLKPGRNRRQVSLIRAEDWRSATGELGVSLPWWKRRANLLVENLDIPRMEGVLIRIGPSCLLEVTMECDPCARMDEIAAGLQAALAPGWRGGFLTRVLEGGPVALGDAIRIEA